MSFLFTDVEGSTRLWEKQPDEMPGVLARHDALLILRRLVDDQPVDAVELARGLCALLVGSVAPPLNN